MLKFEFGTEDGNFRPFAFDVSRPSVLVYG